MSIIPIPIASRLLPANFAQEAQRRKHFRAPAAAAGLGGAPWSRVTVLRLSPGSFDCGAALLALRVTSGGGAGAGSAQTGRGRLRLASGVRATGPLLRSWECSAGRGAGALRAFARRMRPLRSPSARFGCAQLTNAPLARLASFALSRGSSPLTSTQTKEAAYAASKILWWR